jgi:hypothetical protein
MRFKDITGREVNSDKEEVKCPYCGENITKEEIENGEQYHKVWHIRCVEPDREGLNDEQIIKISEWKRKKFK